MHLILILAKDKLTIPFFKNTGKDALEFSGSNIQVKNCHVIKAREKGINAGMDAKVSVNDLTIKDTKIAVSSTDLSEISINNIELINCEQGFVAYQQNPEYGGAKITVNNSKYEAIKRLYSVEEGSVLKIDDKVVSWNK